MAVEQIGTATFRLDNTRSARDSSELDDQRDGGAHKRVDPVRNGRCSRAEGLLGNPFRSWISSWRDGGSRSDENTSWETGTRGTCADWKIPAEEMSSNLHRFKELMETGKVTDTSYSVPGKFT